MKKSIITFSIILYAVAVPFLEINNTHVFNPDWTPHVRIHETKISTVLSLIIIGGFLLAYILQDFYGGSMKYLDGSEKTLLGINIGVLGFGIAFILLLLTLIAAKQKPKIS